MAVSGAAMHTNHLVPQTDFGLSNTPIPSGRIFVSWWDNGCQTIQFLSFGPEHSAAGAEILERAKAKAATDPDCTVELWLCAGILTDMRSTNHSSSHRYVAALAQYKGWHCFAVQELPDGHCFLSQVNAANESDFAKTVFANLRRVEIPPESGMERRASNTQNLQTSTSDPLAGRSILVWATGADVCHNPSSTNGKHDKMTLLQDKDDSSDAFRAAVMSELLAHDIIEVTVEFEGYGDEGQVENITCMKSDGHEGPLEFPTKLSDKIIPAGTRVWDKETRQYVTQAVDRPATMAEILDEWSYELLDQTKVDWVNNEGGYGEIVITPATNSIHCHMNRRFTDSVASHHKL